MNRTFVALPAWLMLAACGGQPAGEKSVSLTNASPEEVAAAAAGGAGGQFRPGMWETSYEIESLDIPGMPAGPMRDQMSKMMKGKVETDSSCMTPEEAKRPKAEMFAGKGRHDCTYGKFTMAGGRIDATMTCPAAGPGGGEMTMTMAGDFSPETYAMTATADMKDGPAPVTMKIKVDGRRTGDCK